MQKLLITPTPAYSYREFDHDLKQPECEGFSLKRATLVALPYICLYQPVGFLLGVGMGGCRVVKNISAYEQTTESFLQTAASVAALVSTIFMHPVGVVISTFHDIGIEWGDFVREVKSGHYEEGMGSLIQVANSSAYLAMFALGGGEWLAYSLVLQLLNLLYKARREYTRGRYFEVIGHLGMATIRGRQVGGALNALGISLEKLKISNVLYYLRMPFDQTMGRVMRCTGSYVSCNKPVESGVIGRVQWIASTVFLISSIPLSLALFGVAAMIDSVRGKFDSNRYEYLEGTADAKLGSPKKIMTWNVCSLFGGLSIPFGGVAPVEDRVHAIAQNIIETQADLVCLQEVSPPAAYLLYEQLKTEYKYFFARIEPDPLLTLDSGIFVASKSPLINPSVTALPRLGLMRRAFFSFKIGETTFGVTHLEPGQGEAAKAMREKQLRVILSQAPEIFLGDMNENFFDTCLKETYASPNIPEKVTATDRFIGVPMDFSIDYILSRSRDRVKVLLKEAYEIGKWALSDHHILVAETE